MTRKFEFKNNNLKLDIAGNLFEIDTMDTEIVENTMKFGQDAQKKSQQLGKKEDYVEALKEATQFCLDSIDIILGEGASSKIFSGRKVNLFDALDVMNYIVSEVKEDRESKFQAYSPNRAQRRAAK